jgi:hypothetical protein
VDSSSSMDKMKGSMPATTEKDSLFSDSMMRWMDEGDRLHEDPRHGGFAGEATPARRPWRLWLGAFWVVLFVVGGRFALQRLGAGEPASVEPTTPAAVVGSPSLAVSPPAVVPAPSPTVTAAPAAEAAAGSAIAAPAKESPSELPPAAVNVKPVVQDVPAPSKAAPIIAAEPEAPPVAKAAVAETPAPAVAAAPGPAVAEAAPIVEDFDALLARCRDATTRGRWGAARTACNAAQQARPDSPDVLTRLAEIALNRGQGRAAMRLASAALAADPAFADAYVIVGSVEQGANRNQEARAAYSHYLKLAPSGRYASDLRAILATL